MRDSSNSSTLFLSIVKSLRGLLSKPFLTISITVRGLFGVLGSSQEGTNFTLVDAMVNSGIQEARKEIGSAQPRLSKKLGGLRYTGYIF